MEASLITTVASTTSQSDVVGMKSEYCLNRFMRCYSLVGLCVDS